MVNPVVIRVKFEYAKIFPYTLLGSERETELRLWNLKKLDTVE